MAKEEHGTVRTAVDKLVDTAGGVIGQMAAATTATADSFVENATIGDLYEREAALLAFQRGRSAEVKAFARQMLDDHMTSTHHLRAALEMNETKGVQPPPRQLDERRQTMIDHLKAAPDDSFDQSYVNQQVMAHEETATLMRAYWERGDNPQLQSYAAGTAPVVERHLEHVRKLKDVLS